MNNGTEIKFNKEQANYGIDELKQCQRELYEADKLFYKGIMALASARGMDLILKEDAGINLYMPERIVIECREEITNLIEEISGKIALIEGFNEEPKEGTDVQYRKVEEKIEDKASVQPLYGVPTPKNPEEVEVGKPIQALYAPPGVEVPEYGEGGPIQALYAPPGMEVPEYNPVVQPMYGVVTPTDPVVVPGPVQALYAPPGFGEGSGGNIGSVQALYAAPDLRQTVGGMNSVPQAVYAPPNYMPTDTIPEYETIPNTGIPGVIEKNYVSKHPRLIGGLAATIGLFGIPTMLSDDYDEEEEFRLNEKKD